MGLRPKSARTMESCETLGLLILPPRFLNTFWQAFQPKASHGNEADAGEGTGTFRHVPVLAAGSRRLWGRPFVSTVSYRKRVAV